MSDQDDRIVTAWSPGERLIALCIKTKRDFLESALRDPEIVAEALRRYFDGQFEFVVGEMNAARPDVVERVLGLSASVAKREREDA